MWLQKKNLLFEIIDDVRAFQTKSIQMLQPHTHALITQNIFFKVWVGIKVRFKRWYGRGWFILGWVSRLVIARCIVWLVNDANPGRERSSHRRTLLTSPLEKRTEWCFPPWLSDPVTEKCLELQQQTDLTCNLQIWGCFAVTSHTNTLT